MRLVLSIFLMLVVAACSRHEPAARRDDAAMSSEKTVTDPAMQTRIIVLGTIHTRHHSSARYRLAFLEQTIRTINPDLILAEIPPERFDEAIHDYATEGVVMEQRVARFPEYTEVIIPLQVELGFKIVPTAAWTQPMAEARTVALNKIARDPARADDWARYTIALDAMNKQLTGKEDDPFYIHSDDYDAIVKQGLAPYATLFANQLGTGDWEQVNRAHFELINQALDQISGTGKTVVITFGAAHKYWFREQLALRKDVKLVSPQAYLEAAATQRPDLR